MDVRNLTGDLWRNARSLLRSPGGALTVVLTMRNEAGKLSLLELYDLKEQARLFEDFASARNTQYNSRRG